MAIAAGLVVIPLAVWSRLVNQEVPQPYLDEIFHVPQAQRYCDGDWHSWDPKITTPPGTYILSTLLRPGLGCKIDSLRLCSAVSLVLLARFAEGIYSVYSDKARRDNQAERSDASWRWQSAHSALNIALFPPLFFFSALYYTDVPSTLSVLAFHKHLVLRQSTPLWQRNARFFILGALSLSFRQTNIFWVALFPAAVVLVSEIDNGHEVVKNSMYRQVEGFGDSLVSVIKTSWKMNVVYDQPVTEARFDDYVRFVVSTITCVMKLLSQPRRLLHIMWILLPFIALLGSFAAFTLWNGSVVLGDKSNHVATLHLPQMLYIWSFIVFFSWPIVYQYLIILPLGYVANLPALSHLGPLLMFKRRRRLPHPRYIILFSLLAAAIVKYNTIVHPFTLADNRHYTFYVFRLLMRPWWIRFAVVPVYIACAWACVQILGSPSSLRKTSAVSRTTTEATPATLILPDSEHAAKTSFVLVWLVTSALQLITAPLVEPRYFILPWIFWRLHVPMRPTESSSSSPSNQPQRDKAEPLAARLKRIFWDEQDHRLWLETTWFVAINTVTGYIFLKWGFEWPSEPRSTQRFMW